MSWLPAFFRFKMRIAVIGSQNTGKTTLVKRLLQDCPGLQTPTTTYREFAIAHRLPLNEVATNASQQAIATFYLQQIEKYRHAPQIVWDRFLIDVWVYTSLLPNPDRDFLDHLFHQTKSACEDLDLIVLMLLSPLIPLTEDGLRSLNPYFLDRVNSRFVQVVFELEIPRHKLFVYSHDRYRELLGWIKGAE